MSFEPTGLCLTAQTATLLVARELAAFSERLARVEHGVEHICNEIAGAPRSEALVALQEIDVLHQSAEALAGYLDVLSAALPGSARIDVAPALAQVNLRGLASRLSGSDLPENPPGTPEMF